MYNTIKHLKYCYFVCMKYIAWGEIQVENTAHMQTHTRKHTNTHKSTCTHTHIYTHINTNTNTYTHIQTQNTYKHTYCIVKRVFIVSEISHKINQEQHNF